VRTERKRMGIIMQVSPAKRRGEIKDERCARTNAAGGEERRKRSRKGRRDYAMIECVVRAVGRRSVEGGEQVDRRGRGSV
jgi:hypothetical protein